MNYEMALLTRMSIGLTRLKYMSLFYPNTGHIDLTHFSMKYV